MKVISFKIATNNKTGDIFNKPRGGSMSHRASWSKPWSSCQLQMWELAASFYCQLAAWFPDMFCNFYVMKNYKIAENSTPTKARENISTESLEFQKNLDVCWTKFKDNQTFLNKIGPKSLLINKLVTG